MFYILLSDTLGLSVPAMCFVLACFVVPYVMAWRSVLSAGAGWGEISGDVEAELTDVAGG